jgi:hypothetical protein
MLIKRNIFQVFYKLKLHLLEFKRDLGALTSFLLVVPLCAILYLASSGMEKGEEEKAAKSRLFGIYLSLVLVSNNRVCLMTYFAEKQNKTKSFLNVVGMSDLVYFLSHIIWNVFMNVFMLLPLCLTQLISLNLESRSIFDI